MKGIILSVSLSLIVTLLQGQEILVKSQKDPDTNFGRYATYYWADQVDGVLDEGGFFLKDLILKADIRHAVRLEMESRGYRLESHNPDLIVNFRVFNRATRLQGYVGYGSSYWGTHEYNAVLDNRKGEAEAGTLILSVVDRVRNVLVWEGMASGLFENGAFVKDEDAIAKAVGLLFEDYGLRVAEYTRR